VVDPTLTGVHPRSTKLPVPRYTIVQRSSFLVFARTERGADRLAKKLSRDGLKATPSTATARKISEIRLCAAFKTALIAFWWPQM